MEKLFSSILNAVKKNKVVSIILLVVLVVVIAAIVNHCNDKRDIAPIIKTDKQQESVYKERLKRINQEMERVKVSLNERDKVIANLEKKQKDAENRPPMVIYKTVEPKNIITLKECQSQLTDCQMKLEEVTGSLEIAKELNVQYALEIADLNEVIKLKDREIFEHKNRVSEKSITIKQLKKIRIKWLSVTVGPTVLYWQSKIHYGIGVTVGIRVL